jgi:hypothetical protein
MTRLHGRAAAAAVTAVAIFAVILIGCTTTDTQVKTDGGGNTSGTTGTTGSTTNPNVPKISEDPGADVTDLDRYPGSIRLSDTIVKGAGGKNSGTLIYQTGEEVVDVVEFYLDEADEKDWTVKEVIDTKDGKIIQLAKGSRSVSVVVSRRENIDYTDITIQYREY